jgi:hypothetical protein
MFPQICVSLPIPDTPREGSHRTCISHSHDQNRQDIPPSTHREEISHLPDPYILKATAQCLITERTMHASDRVSPRLIRDIPGREVSKHAMYAERVRQSAIMCSRRVDSVRR